MAECDGRRRISRASHNRRLRPQRAVLCAVLAMLACKGDGNKSPKQRAEPAPSSAQGGASGDADGLPVAWRPVVAGDFQAAPWLAGALRVAIGENRGKPVIAAASVGALKVFSPDGSVLAEHALAGTPHVLRFAGDEIVVASGIGVESRDASAELLILSGPAWKQRKAIELGNSSRQQVVDVAIGPDGELVVAHFVSKYQVAISKVDRAAGRALVDRGAKIRMVGGIDFVTGGEVALAVARVYGDARGEPGRVELMKQEGGQELPSLRGARAIRYSPSDSALVIADGWHREYRAKAKALITRLTRNPDSGAWNRQVLAHVEGGAGFTSLTLGDIDGDGETDVVAAGHGPAVAVPISASGGVAAQALGGGQATDAAIGDIDGDGAPEVVVAGTEPGIWRATK